MTDNITRFPLRPQATVTGEIPSENPDRIPPSLAPHDWFEAARGMAQGDLVAVSVDELQEMRLRCVRASNELYLAVRWIDRVLGERGSE